MAGFSLTETESRERSIWASCQNAWCSWLSLAAVKNDRLCKLSECMCKCLGVWIGLAVWKMTICVSCRTACVGVWGSQNACVSTGLSLAGWKNEHLLGCILALSYLNRIMIIIRTMRITVILSPPWKLYRDETNLIWSQVHVWFTVGDMPPFVWWGCGENESDWSSEGENRRAVLMAAGKACKSYSDLHRLKRENLWQAWVLGRGDLNISVHANPYSNQCRRLDYLLCPQ